LSPTYLSSHLFLRFPKNLKNLILLMFLMCHLHPMCLMSLRFLK
jgi:hypothetical protein